MPPDERCDGTGELPHAMTGFGGSPFGPYRKCPGCPVCQPQEDTCPTCGQLIGPEHKSLAEAEARIRLLRRRSGPKAVEETLERLAAEFEGRAMVEAEKRGEVKASEAADRVSGKLAADHSYEATWNYHEGLGCAYQRAATLLRQAAGKGGDDAGN